MQLACTRQSSRRDQGGINGGTVDSTAETERGGEVSKGGRAEGFRGEGWFLGRGTWNEVYLGVDEIPEARPVQMLWRFAHPRK